MRFNDRAADPKSHPGAVSLGGKEGIENLVRLLRGQPHTGIANRHHYLFAIGTPRVDGKLARPIHIFHRVDAIHHEVHHDLLQLHTVCHYPRKRLRQLRPYCYGLPRYLVAQEDDHLPNEFVYVNQLPLRNALLEYQADSGDDFRRTGCVFDDSRRSLTRFFQIGLIAREPAQAGISVGDGSSNRLIDLVRQGCSQLSHGGHSVDVCEIQLRFFGPLAGADVHRTAHEWHKSPDASKTGWPTVWMYLTVPPGRRIRNSMS